MSATPDTKKKKAKTVLPHKSEFLLVALFTIVIVAITFGVLLPQANTLAEKMQLLSSVEEQNTLQSESIRQQQQAERAAKDTLQTMNLQDAILREKDAVKLIEQLEQIALAAGVEQNISFQHTARSQQGDIITIPVSIQVSGEWSELVEYITTIEQSYFYINPARLSLSETTDINGDELPSIIIQANTYWLQ